MEVLPFLLHHCLSHSDHCCFGHDFQVQEVQDRLEVVVPQVLLVRLLKEKAHFHQRLFRRLELSDHW